ncbi:MAG TPA: type II secretion system protein [Rhodocyclaceae bacterium]|nr:type II secretion system protein [Rhodocyclaceae bacterium]
MRHPGDTRSRQRGFTLVELAIVLLIVAVLIGGLMVPLSAQMDIRNRAETDRTLADAREALLGYAAANGRLPCPASTASNGRASPESCGAGGQCVCTNPHDGLLPAVTLGLQPTDSQGYAIDAWNNRIRYAVTGANAWAFTSSGTAGLRNAVQAAGFASLAPDLLVCASSTGITATACGGAGNELSTTAAAVLVSTGRNGPASNGADEAANLDGNRVFVSHVATAAGGANGEFDDIVTWLSPNILYNRLITAGQLP